VVLVLGGCNGSDGGAAPDYVELCWDQLQPDQDGNPVPHPPVVSVFRATVQVGPPDVYRQRSPRVQIAQYVNKGILDPDAPELTCGAACAADLGAGAGAQVVCWRDYGIEQGKTYRYTVLGFAGAPSAQNPDRRNEGEIQGVYGSPPAAAQVAVP
jgi:hypothetical protein